MDTALIVDGIVAQVWRDTPKDELPEPEFGKLVEFDVEKKGMPVCGMAWSGKALSTTVPSLSPDDLKVIAADKRWSVETGGCIWNGWPVSTDRESQSKLIAGFVMLGSNLRVDGGEWKFADGVFRALTNAQFAALIAGALAHIQTAFAREAELLAAIDGGTVTKRSEIESWDWP